MIIAFFELLEAEGKTLRGSLLGLGQSFALILCAGAVITASLLSVLGAIYIGLSPMLGMALALLATGGVGLLMGLLIWWLGATLSR